MSVDGARKLWTNETWVTGGMHTCTWITPKVGERWDGCYIVERTQRKDCDPFLSTTTKASNPKEFGYFSLSFKWYIKGPVQVLIRLVRGRMVPCMSFTRCF